MFAFIRQFDQWAASRSALSPAQKALQKILNDNVQPHQVLKSTSLLSQKGSEGHSKICEACTDEISSTFWNITRTDDKPWPEVKLRHLERIQESSNECDFCALVTSEVPSTEIDWLLGSNDRVFRVEIFFGGQRLRHGFLDCIHIRARFRKTHDLHYDGRFRISTDEGSPLSDYISSQHLDSDPLSQKSLKTINDWIEACEEGHAGCPNGDEMIALPTRVLDLHRLDLSSPTPSVRLVEHIIGGRYVALSHCWGTWKRSEVSGQHWELSHSSTDLSTATTEPTGLTTTKSTLQARKKQIAVHTLPKTFQDAIRVTKALKIRYLWIDSLCIIQDDVHDWEHEAGQMADIYSKAYLTIAAAHSNNDFDGFLSERPCIQIKMKPEIGGNVYVSRSKIEAAPIRTDIQDLDNEPLHKRAWTLQERYLSRRILHYSKYQMFWECNEGIFAERGDQAKRACCFDSVLQGESKADPPWFPTWIAMVEKYSARKLTVAEDRLPALSGMASRLALATGDWYYAGVWRNRILQGISWQRRWPPMNHNMNNRLPGPSWSWASISDPVSFHPRLAEERTRSYYSHAVVSGCEVEPKASENPYGAVISGQLRIRAPVLRILSEVSSHHLIYWDRDQAVHFPCTVLILWSQLNRLSTDSFSRQMGYIGLIISPTHRVENEFERVGLMAPGIGEPRDFLVYEEADVKDVCIV